MRSRGLFWLGVVALALVLAWRPVNSAYHGYVIRQQQEAIRRDESGIMKVIRVADVSDIRYVRVASITQSLLGKRAIFELDGDEHASEIRHLLAILANADQRCNRPCIHGSPDSYRMVIAREHGAPIEITGRNEYLTDSRGNVPLYTCPNIRPWLGSMIGRSDLRERHRHLDLPDMDVIEAEYPGRRTHSIECGHSPRDRHTGQACGLARHMLETPDPRMQLMNLSLLDSTSYGKHSAWPTPGGETPIIRVRFVKALQVTALDSSGVLDPEKETLLGVFTNRLREDRLQTREMRIACAENRIWIALVPDNGRDWYIAIVSDAKVRSDDNPSLAQYRALVGLLKQSGTEASP